MNNDFEWQQELFKLRSAKPADRISAARALSSNPEPRSSYFLAQALYDEHPFVRKIAALGLSRIGNECAVASLVRVIASKNFEVDKEAVEALENTRSAKAVKRIVQLLNNPQLRPAALFTVRLIANAFYKRQETSTEAALELAKAGLLLLFNSTKPCDEKEKKLAEEARVSLVKLKRLKERDQRDLQAKTLQLQKTIPTSPCAPCKVIDINKYRPPTQTRTPVAK
ncbi:HEAT repeat domain-containing protein [Candidatus Micrarchaeota archaeon]|nr:HEAT repeat domain-containing protein [Candidatus Micrarchaeota archaeon]